MLRLLLDEHISPSVADGLRRRHPRLSVVAMTEWHGGSFLGQDAAACLQQALAQQLTLVTCDRRTIPPILRRWAEESRSHAGVIFVDEKTISPADIGGLVNALERLLQQSRDWNWTNRIVFLRR